MKVAKNSSNNNSILNDSGNYNGVIVKLNGSSCNNSNSNILANNVYVKKNSSLDKINSHNNKENNINKENNNNLIIYKKINNTETKAHDFASIIIF